MIEVFIVNKFQAYKNNFKIAAFDVIDSNTLDHTCEFTGPISPEDMDRNPNQTLVTLSPAK